MKKFTISLPNDIYRRARRRAIERGGSIGKLVKDFLVGLAGCDEAEFERRMQLQDKIMAEIRLRGFSASDRLTRSEVHERKQS